MTEGDVRNQLDTDERETPELKVRRYEEIYRFAQKAYDEEGKLSGQIDTKASIFLTATSVLLGLAVPVIKEVVGISHRICGWVPSLLCVLSLVCLVCICSAVIILIMALKPRKALIPPVGGKPIIYLEQKTTYLEALDKLSLEYMWAAKMNHGMTEQKAKWVSGAYYLLFVIVLTALFGVFLYLSTIYEKPATEAFGTGISDVLGSLFG